MILAAHLVGWWPCFFEAQYNNILNCDHLLLRLVVVAGRLLYTFTWYIKLTAPNCPELMGKH